MTKHEVAYGFREETLEAKTRWFMSLSIPERLEILSEFTEFAIQMNPRLLEGGDDLPVGRNFQVLSRK